MKKTMPLLIGVAVLVGGGSFYGGMQYAQAKSASARGARMGQFAAGGQYPGGGTGARTGGFRGGNGGFVGGEILSNDGKTMTLKMNSGGSKIVFLSDTTEVSKFVAGATADLTVGQNVMVVGKTNDDGSVTAQSVQIRPPMPAGAPGTAPTTQPKQ